MKKLLLLSVLLLNTVIFGQSQKEEFDDLLSMMSYSTKHMNNRSKLDSLDIRVSNLLSTSKNPAVISTATKFKESLSGLLSLNTDKPTVSLNDVPEEFKKDFRIEYDKFKDVTFVTSKKANGLNIRFYPYIGISGNNVSLRIVNIYQGKDWIFFNSVQMLANGKSYTYNTPNPTREVNNGVYESTDILVDPQLLRMLENITLSDEKVEYRLSGEYSKDYILSAKEIEIVKNTLLLYLKLIEKK